MPNTYFPISNEASASLSLQGPVLRGEKTASLYQEAQKISYRINGIKSENKTYVTPGILLSLLVIRAAKLDVLSDINRNQDDALYKSLFEASKSALQEKKQQLIPLYTASYPMEIETTDRESLEDIVLLIVESQNPALRKNAADMLYSFEQLKETAALGEIAAPIERLIGTFQVPDERLDLFSLLTAPFRHAPDSIEDQLSYILTHWRKYLSTFVEALIVRTSDFIKEETKASFPPGPGPSEVPDYQGFLSVSDSGMEEYEAFSMDSDWMPNVIMLAKSTLVWLDQLSKQYGYHVERLDQIPDEELDLIASRGFNTLWLIGLWERSESSKWIKQSMGNQDAEASAYSLKNYDIAGNLGGWGSLDNLRYRCGLRGIRLASDMVPNHTGLDSDWVFNRPDLFLRSDYPPFPSYTYNSQNLSPNPDVGIYLEDHYYNHSDAAVTFKRVDHRTGETTYIYHGNDGTSMPWNDTAQLDYLNPVTREILIQTILHVAKNFPVIRFDAAMTLAKKHIQRLWYPAPGHGGDIPSRAAHGLSQDDFDRALPVEFWREVVDRVAEEAPDTLLLAEAFWMMEGYFVRTLGMHRVYNSAFMNMLKNEENRKYRDAIKNTLAFNPEILKRFVNFMNNPDEETAIEQFGNGDKYFGVCTLLITMPGLPMIGHGQVEGYREKYGMEFSKAYWDEHPDQMLIEAHERRIFPLMKRRYLFSGSENFALFDVADEFGVKESIYAYTNGAGKERTMVFYNNAYESASGWIRTSSSALLQTGNDDRIMKSRSLGAALLLHDSPNHFCLLKGFHDGLTYIRRSADIYAQGMFVSLNGYETQVFLDFREFEDQDETLARLCEHLDGAGTADWELELKRLRLQEIHQALRPALSKKTVALTKMLLNGDKEAEKALYEVLTKTVNRTAEVWNTGYFPEGSGLYQSSCRADTSLIARAIRRVGEIGAGAFSLKTPLAAYCRNALRIMPELPALITGWIALLPVTPTEGGEAAFSSAGELLFHELLHDRLYEVGIHIHDSYRVTSAVDLIRNQYGWPERAAQAGSDLLELIIDPLFRSFAKINWHEGVEWYHKESLQEGFSLMVMTALLEDPSLLADDTGDIHKRVLSWMQRESRAAYRVENLLKEDAGNENIL